MVIGIKYCGGCNPGYVREELVKKLKERFPHHIYVTASERTECDIWLWFAAVPRPVFQAKA